MGNNTIGAYKLLVQHFPEMFPPLAKIYEKNPLASKPHPPKPEEYKHIELSLSREMTVDEICNWLKEQGTNSVTFTFSEGGQPIQDEYYDDDCEDWVYGTVGETSEKIFLSGKVRHKDYQRKITERDVVIRSINDAAKHNASIAEKNRIAEQMNDEFIRRAQREYTEYWRAACKAFNKNDLSELKEKVRAVLEEKLARLDQIGK